MTTIDPKAPVMVSGATGYVAGWVVKTLLDKGHTVHAAVRDPDNASKVAHLKAMADTAPGEIRFFKADLMDAGSYADAMAGCELVFHTASPFAIVVKDALKDLVEPAQLGTRNVLEQANQTPSVKRVVLTSSCAAVYGDNADVAKASNGVLTEEVWNTSSSMTHQAYSYSKLLAEKEAWAIVEKQDRWDLVVVNPALVLGPGTKVHTGESFALMTQMGDGTLKMGAPRMGMGIVDVRDLADAHYRAGFTPEAKGRHILAGYNSDLSEIAALLRPKFGDRYPIPKGTLPKWLMWLVGPMVNKAVTRKTVSLNANLPWKADNSKGKRDLGVTYRPLEDTVTEHFQQLIDHGAFDKKK